VDRINNNNNNNSRELVSCLFDFVTFRLIGVIVCVFGVQKKSWQSV
jgi:hypothetical protein